MRGILDIEFVLSITLFLSVIVFVSFVITGNIPVFHGESVNEDLRARSYQISQLLMFDQGQPANWNPSNVQRIGLSTGTAYNLSSTKVSNLASLCSGVSGYNNVRSLLSLDTRNDVRISIVDEAGAARVNCSRSRTTIFSEFPIVRFGVLDTGQLVRLTVSVI